jgi:hypothetical protein
VTLVPTFFTCSSANPVNFTALNNGESFTADFTLSSLRKVTGRLVNCLGNPVSGRVVLNFTSLLGSQVHTSCYTNSTGVFYLPMEIGTTYGTINAYGNSTDTLKYIYPSSIDTLVDVGDIYLCVPATPGINSLTLFGGPYTSSTTVSTFDGTRTGYKFTGTSGTHTLINAYGSMGEFSMGITGTALNVNYPIGAKSVTWVNIYLYSPTFFSDTMSSGTVKITKFGPVGGLIEGTFSGVTGQGVQITNGKFSVIRTPDQP